MPSDRAASVWPFGTAWMPARMRLGHVGAGHQDQRDQAGTEEAAGIPVLNAIGTPNAITRKHDQGRQAPEELDVPRCEPPVRRDGGQLHQGQHHAEREAEHEGDSV